MAVRMSTSQLFNRGLNPILDAQTAVSKTQQQIASNKRVLTPADDPIAATRILQLNQEMASIEKYNNSISGLSSRLQREEVALDGVNDLIQRAQELVTQSGNGALAGDQRAYIAVELESVVDAMAQYMNSKDAGGEYLFSGNKGSTQPFVKDNEGKYVYQGDQGQRFVQIGPVTSVAANDSGYDLFVNIKSARPGVISSASDGNTAQPPASISKASIRNQELFDKFHPGSAIVEFRPANEINPPGLNYTIKQVEDGRVLAQNIPYVSGREIEVAGMAFRVDGRPAEGDSFTLASTNQKGLLEGLQDYVETLKTSQSGLSDDALKAEMNATLENLNRGQDQVLKTTAAIGARLNQTEAAQASNADFELLVSQSLSELADLDYAAAISQLSEESFVLEAAQTTFTKITRLSLFNML